MNKEEEYLENQLFFSWIDDVELRNKLTARVNFAKEKRSETQLELSNVLEISLTKIKEIEKGSCKDFNAINNYLNYFWECFY